ncbi:MAG TPA: hypothetical protein VFP98_02390 [Candidatus Polarisedimenticolia bacterium]|nr:hypothetical protein [Candidatus Polarisedimenticolia bacterium]
MRPLRDGLKAAARNGRLLGWLLAANVVVAFAAVLPLMAPLEETLSRHPSSAELTRRFDMSWWVDLTTAHAASFERALDLAGAAAMASVLFGCFFAGGMLQAHHDVLGGLRMDRFFIGCRRWFVRFVWLFVLSLPLYWLAHRLVNTHLALWIGERLEWVEDERAGLAIEWGRSVLFLALFDLVTLMADYARVHAVVAGDRSMLAALAAGMRFVLRHPWRAGSLEAAAILLQASALALYVPIDRILDRASWPGLAAGVLAGQAFLLARLYLREGARAGQVALYRSVAVAVPPLR